jgi:hypothetical protein
MNQWVTESRLTIWKVAAVDDNPPALDNIEVVISNADAELQARIEHAAASNGIRLERIEEDK